MDLQENQHVQRPQHHRIDGEEVAGQDRAGMGGQELGPGWPVSTRCRRHAMATTDAADRLRRDLEAELEQFALDAPIAPARILSSQAQYQLAQLL